MELERDVERYLVRKVEELGGLCIKHGVEGWPDRICLFPGGMTIWVETKTWKGRLSDLQKIRAQSLRSIGHNVVSIRAKVQVDELLGELKDE